MIASEKTKKLANDLAEELDGHHCNDFCRGNLGCGNDLQCPDDGGDCPFYSENSFRRFIAALGTIARS